MALDAFTQFFTNETARGLAWEGAKATASAAGEYMPEAKTLLITAAAVVLGGAAVVGVRRNGLPDRNTFTAQRWRGQSKAHPHHQTDSGKPQDPPAEHTRSHDHGTGTGTGAGTATAAAAAASSSGDGDRGRQVVSDDGEVIQRRSPSPGKRGGSEEGSH